MSPEQQLLKPNPTEGAGFTLFKNTIIHELISSCDSCAFLIRRVESQQSIFIFVLCEEGTGGRVIIILTHEIQSQLEHTVLYMQVVL